MGFGTGGFLAIAKQNSFGTAGSDWQFVPFISETLVTNIEPLVEESIQNRFEEGPSHDGIISAEGDIVMEAHPVLLGHFLRGALGPSSYVAAGDAYSNIFPPTQADFSTKCALPPYTVQVYRDVGSAFQFTDSLINALTLEISAGGFVRVTASVLARTSSLMAPSTASYAASTPWAWDSASISIGGSANADLETVTVKVENNIEGIATLDATKRWNRMIRNGFRTFMISGQMDFSDQTEYNVFRAGTEQRFVVNIKGDTEVASGYYNEMNIDLPSVRYDTYEATIGGPNRLQANFEGKAKYNTGSGRAMLVTLQNSQDGY